MEKLIAELTRLYLPPGVLSPEALDQYLRGQACVAVNLATADHRVRAIVIPFDKTGHSEDGQHWNRLCTVANVLHAELGLPMPAVSVSGTNGYRLWLSFEAPVPAHQAERFLELLRVAHLPDMESFSKAVGAPIELPPCLDPRTGRWAAFIHPGMGASFADESGLEMAPPLAGQVAFLEDLESITLEQFNKARDMLQQAQSALTPNAQNNSSSIHEATTRYEATPRNTATPDGLLLKDATLEDIVKFLHSKNIEPTFRHLITR